MTTGLLLVEDEPALQRKLRHNIVWADYGFDPVLIASNGLEALAILAEQPIQIVVTDVQMPKMNGLELIKEIKRRNYPMKIIVISGFAEFEYAQESIKLNVSDYLLKPFASRRLLEVVLRFQHELRQEQAEKTELNELREQLAKNKEVLQEKFFIDLLNGNFASGSLADQIDFLGLAELQGQPYQVVVVEIPENQLAGKTEEDKYLLNLQLVQQLQKAFADQPTQQVQINLRRNQMALIVFTPETTLPLQLEAVLAQLRVMLNISLSCGLGHPYHDFTDLAVSYKEACTALHYRYLYGLNRVFSINDLNLVNPSYHKIFHLIHHHSIFDNLKIGADGAIQKDLKDLIAELRQTGISPELAKIVAGNLILLTNITLNELGYNSSEIFGSEYATLIDVSGTESLAELETMLEAFFQRIIRYINTKRLSLNHQLVAEIRKVIDENFATDITLSEMANRYKISPSYLSLLFTERIGKNFSDYLSERRMMRAKELLKHSERKIYEIATEVGYNDSFYFSNCFKKWMGVSPSEYREKARNQNS